MKSGRLLILERTPAEKPVTAFPERQKAAEAPPGGPSRQKTS
jgi:hypothetical protein